MTDDAKRGDAASAMRAINQAWLRGRVEEMAPSLHPDVVMALPGFAGSVQGRERFLAGFHDFCRNATIHGFEEHDLRADTAGHTAVVTFRYDMTYERSGKRYHSTGRDLWVFQLQDGAWIAVWRTMLDSQETPA